MRILLVSLALVALFVACGGGSPEFSEAAPLAADEAVIAAKDLPAGWEQSSSTLDNVALPDGCKVLTPEGAFPAAGATASSRSYSTTDRRSAQSFSAVFRSADEASQALSDLDRTVERCHGAFVDAVHNAAKDVVEPLGVKLGPLLNIDVSIEKGSPPAIGDEALLYQVGVRVNALGANQEFNADISVVRNGRVVGVMIYSAYARIDVSDQSALLAVIKRRLESAEKKLP
ncbi:MAG TPA: hypothetical protein VLS25_03635 [Dehalococcoidia bacterium]|nr:hypothetical protein [Dehalococcoidia bacterium]